MREHARDLAERAEPGEVIEPVLLLAGLPRQALAVLEGAAQLAGPCPDEPLGPRDVGRAARECRAEQGEEPPPALRQRLDRQLAEIGVGPDAQLAKEIADGLVIDGHGPAKAVRVRRHREQRDRGLSRQCPGRVPQRREGPVREEAARASAALVGRGAILQDAHRAAGQLAPRDHALEHAVAHDSRVGAAVDDAADDLLHREPDGLESQVAGGVDSGPLELGQGELPAAEGLGADDGDPATAKILQDLRLGRAGPHQHRGGDGLRRARRERRLERGDPARAEG